MKILTSALLNSISDDRFRCLEEAISLHKKIKEDFYIIPYAIVEIGLLHIDQNRLDLAMSCLEDAKKNYTGYSLESRLHFRIHTALSDLRSQKEIPTVYDDVCDDVK